MQTSKFNEQSFVSPKVNSSSIVPSKDTLHPNKISQIGSIHPTSSTIQSFGSSIVMEIYGVNRPKKKIVELLNKTIQEKLTTITIEKIANAFLKSSGLMTKEDLNYI